MTTNDETADGAELALPVLLIVDADRDPRVATEAALLRRFAADYQLWRDKMIVACSSPEHFLRHGIGLCLMANDIGLTLN